MKAIRYFCFCLLILSFPSGFCSGHHRIDHEQLVIQTIYLTHGIISRSPELIKWQDGDKIYLDERFIKKNIQDGRGRYVHIDPDYELYLPIIFSDENGFFTSVSREFWDKPFHQICNKCQYEWQGGVFTMRCPDVGAQISAIYKIGELPIG